MRHYFIICFLLISQGLYSQSNLTFKYVLTDYTLKNPMKSPLWDSLITTKRQIISSNEFIDFGLLCSDFSKECSMKFRTDDKQNWFVFFERQWRKIYEASNDKLQNVEIKSNEISIVPVLNKKIVGGKYPLLCYRIFNRKQHEPDNTSLFWFHPKFGVVVIERGDSYYVREDFYKTL
jgi:hypothetical protein